MAVRWSAAFAILVSLAFLLYAGGRAGFIPVPWRPAAEAGLQSALLPAASTLDLETGEQGVAAADLDWGLATRDLPYLGSRGGAEIADAGGARWQDLNAATLANLRYQPGRYSAWGADAPVRPGAVFGVRTAAGNFAKLRIADIRGSGQLRLEWLLYAAQKAQPPATGPAPAWLMPRDEALAAYRAQRYQEALDACGRAVALAEQAGAANHALALLSCGGLTSLHQRAPRQMESWLKQAVAIAATLDQDAIVAALGPGEKMLRERCLRSLGVFYRDQKRPHEAAENFARAVDAVRALPPPETNENRLALRADLFDLGVALAQLGIRRTALKAFAESREYYLKTEPDHPALKEIEVKIGQLQVIQSGNK